MSTIPTYPTAAQPLDGSEQLAAWQNGQQVAIRAEVILDQATASSADILAKTIGLAAIYPDTTAGMAVTAEGSYFSVPGSGDTYLTLYHRVEGVAVAVSTYSTKAAVDEAVTAAALSAQQALASALATNTYPNAYAASLPRGVTNVALGGDAVSGATAGSYALTPTGGSISGVVANLVVTDATHATVVVTNPGLGTGMTPPSFAKPDAATLPPGTTLTATVGVLVPVQGRYWADAGDGLNLARWFNDGTATPHPEMLSDGVTQMKTPLKGAVDAALSNINGKLVDVATGDFTVTDSHGRIVLKIASDGGVYLVSVNALSAIVEAFTLGSGGAMLRQVVGKLAEYSDAAGHVVYDCDLLGNHRMLSAAVRTLTSDTSYALKSFRSPGDKRAGAFRAEINHVIYYGQSWAGGFDAQPAINMAQRSDTLMFNLNAQGEGIRQQYSVAQDATALQSFVPAVENNHTGTPEFPTALLGETGAVAMADTIKSLILAENNLAYTDQNFQILVSWPGEGSKQIEQLADNAQVYMQRLKEQIARAYAIAQASGKTYNVAAVTWLQGSSSIATPYPDQLEAMRADITAYAKSVTGQDNEVLLVTWQQYPNTSTQTATNGSATGVYNRYVVAADTYPNIVCSGPSYQYQQVGATNIHYRPAGMAGLGADLGLAVKRAAIDGVHFQPLRPVSLRRQGKVALLKLNVAAGALVIDTDQVVAIANAGFNLYDSGGTVLTISSVSLLRPDTIKIVAAANIPAGATLRYADTGTDSLDANKWRGNIRDNLGDIGQRHRWLVAFSFPFSN